MSKVDELVEWVVEKLGIDCAGYVNSGTGELRAISLSKKSKDCLARIILSHPDLALIVKMEKTKIAQGITSSGYPAGSKPLVGIPLAKALKEQQGG